MSSPPPDSQLDRIEAKLDTLEGKVDRINGSVARNTQTLNGVDGRGGLIDDVRNLWEEVSRFRRDRMPPGTVSLRTVWGAVGALAAVATVVVAFVTGAS